jgi:hypothetical protein
MLSTPAMGTLCVIKKNTTFKMKLTELIPFLKNEDKWNNLLADLKIDTETEQVLIYALDKLDIDSDILLIELEKTEDNLFITIDEKKYIQIFPYSIANELITFDFVNLNLNSDFDIAQRLIEYRINDA